MSRVKHTKTELKAQKEALRRFERFLPMLQLKKQQLQAEMQAIAARIERIREEADGVRAAMQRWVALFAEPVDVGAWVALRRAVIEQGNIAGVAIPILSAVDMARATPDLFSTPPWIDDAAEAIERLTRLRVEREVFEQQHCLVSEELRTTSQRVNLFEKVKIPECRENIRVIRIFLGDEQTAAVARGKTAKRRAEQAE